MTDWEQVNLRVSPERKQEWEQFVEEHPNANNLSHLIRLAVTREIQGREPSRQEQSSEVSTEVLEALTRIENGLDEVQTRVKALEREQMAASGMDYQQAAFAVLPTEPKGELIEGPNGPTRLDPPAQPPEYGMTVEDVADNLGVDNLDAVKDALDRLSDLTDQVRSSAGPAKMRYYWKRE
ncbi:hypothetical protein [Haladaptatus sp. DJG-WS-42]|uniref:hypothetical protein n=1 Tax=Haladaptatus sp. DJG-WS-42 TaxID=3120516 RepID=UPI0030CFE26C